MPHVCLFLLGLLALAACTPTPPANLNFDFDPRIFRGPYDAAIDLRKSSSMVALNEDASLLVMGSISIEDTTTQVWDVAAEAPLAGAIGESTDTTGVAITRDGSRVALSFRGGVNVWDVEQHTLLFSVPVTTPECPDCGGGHLAYSPDGSLLGVHSGGGRPEKVVLVFDAESGERLLVLRGAEGYVDEPEVRFSPDGTRVLLVGQGREYEVEPPRQISRATIWSLPDGQLLGNFVQQTDGAPQLDAHAWNSQNPVVVVAQEDHLELLDGVSGQDLGLGTLPLKRERAWTQKFYLSPDRRFAAFGYDGKIAVWDVTTGRLLRKEAGDLEPLGFTADSRLLLTHGAEGVALRDPLTLEARRLLVEGAVTTLRVEAEPTYVDFYSYTISGTAALGDVPPAPFEGEVRGNDQQVYVSMSTIPVEPPTMTFAFMHEGEVWRFEGNPAADNGVQAASWWGRLSPAERTIAPYDTRLEPVGAP